MERTYGYLRDITKSRIIGATTSERSDYQTTTDLSKIPAPSMVKENIHQSDENVIKWIQEIDNWMFSVIRTPKSGTMDEQTKLVIQNHLAQVFTPELSEKLIGYFYDYNQETKTYKAVESNIMMGLQTKWQKYELTKTEEPSGLVTILLKGESEMDQNAVMSMTHRSIYKVTDDKLEIVDYTTSYD